MGNTMKGGITLLLIISFPLSVVFGFSNQYLVIAAVIGFLWVIFGNVFDAVGNGVKKLIPEQQQFSSGGGTNARPVDPKPDIIPTSQKAVTPVSEMVSGNTAIQDTDTVKVSKGSKQWFTALVDGAVHILIIGETGSGKSVAAKAILTARAKRGEDIIILDPHARPNTWSGLDAVGKGRDYQAIEQMISILQLELDRRYKEYSADDNYNPKRLNIFVDEVPSIASYCESWQEFFTVISCEARKVNMSLICLSQSRLVDMLGIKGRSDIRENFSELSLGDKAVKLVKDLAGKEYPAALEVDGKVMAVDTSMLPALGATEISEGVLWVPPATLTQQKPVQRLTEASITLAPLSDEEQVKINDWADDGVSRRGIARKLYVLRGGTNTNYDGSGPLFTLVKSYLDAA
jgi:hypothetical protein